MTHAADRGPMRPVLLALCALSLLSGCGGVDASLLATAAHNTQEAGGAEVALRAEMQMPSTGQQFVMTGSGVEDAKAQRARLTMEVPGAGEMEAVSDGLTMYFRPELFGSALGGKEWMKLDARRTNESLGIDGPPLGQMGQSGADQLKLLEQVSGGVTDEGREQVVGVDATHYSATIDLRNYPGQDLQKLIDLTGQSEIPVDVWIDDDQRVRRMEMEMQFAPGQGRMKMIVEYVRFGVPVDIDIPDDDDVFDATDLAIQGLNQKLN
jgi:hypothetical protein